MKKLIYVLLLIPFIGFSQGKLNQAKENLLSKSSSTSYSRNSSSSKDRSDDHSPFNDSFKGFFVELFLHVSYKVAFGSFERRHFSPYPFYYENVYGEYDFGLQKEDKRSLIRVGVNYLEGNPVNSIEANLNYRFHPFVGAEVSHNSFFEKVGNDSNQLDVASLMLNYYRVRERSFTAWWGMGLTYVGNEVNTSGFAYNIGLEVYPIKLISFHLSNKQSFINLSTINTFKFQTKYHKKKIAYYAGYHDISLGGVKASGVIFGFEVRL